MEWKRSLPIGGIIAIGNEGGDPVVSDGWLQFFAQLVIWQGQGADKKNIPAIRIGKLWRFDKNVIDR